ncbi:MAG: primosomal protein N' [Proteobacteria bacterium]|nr:primosomal protein N' [Pseudomonadota bacterium]
MIAKIALSIPLSDLYDYNIPDSLMRNLCVGDRVVVPYNHRTLIGVVVGVVESSNIKKLKYLVDQIDSLPLYDQRIIKLTKWISTYYLCSWGDILDAAIPRGLKPRIKLIPNDKNGSEFGDNLPYRCKLSSFPGCSEKLEKVLLNPSNAKKQTFRKGSKAETIINIIRSIDHIDKKTLREKVPNSSSVINQLISKKVLIIREEPKWKATKTVTINHDKFLKLNHEQAIAFKEIKKAIDENRYKTFLLHGVTSSGKTEIYLHAVKNTLLKGKTVLILIPEISLTPQTTQRFKERFGEQIAVLHSGMGDKERALEWWKIKEEACSIVIGARSAIFAPLKDIGLIVVDEEHDSSYKQHESPHYNARDLAVKIASDLNALVILGSATPSVTSFFNSKKGKYSLLTLKKRAQQAQLPQSYSIDLKNEKRQKGAFYISLKLIKLLRKNLLEKKQAIIFLNRRGFASFLSCSSCEQAFLCRNCSIAMTWHQSNSRLICHHCGHSEIYPKRCSFCKGSQFRREGVGTQRVEQDLMKLFPNARVLRMDRDTIQKKGVLAKNIELINQGEIDFIVGTQLISKGHDFQNIGIVAVLMADMSLNIPDYRSSERSFQIFSQVSGRAGRSEKNSGLTLIQSYNVQNHAIQNAITHNYSAFYEEEIKIRKILDHPPYTRDILIRFSDLNLHKVKNLAFFIGNLLEEKKDTASFQVLGPIESFIPKVNNRYYWEILLKSRKIAHLKLILNELFLEPAKKTKSRGVRISINVDP